jgi:peptidyl-prolyl cis-trans isomerase C
MKWLPLIMVALALAFSGCSRQGNSKKPLDNRGVEGASSGPSTLSGPQNATEEVILISVNGKELTRSEALRQVQVRLGGPPPADMPQDRVTAIQSQVLSKVIDEFVKRELLLREADRLEVTTTDEEVERAIASIHEKSKGGDKPQGILQDGPGGKDSLRNEVITGIRIEKLLATVLPPVTAPTEKDIQSFLAENLDKLTLPERVQASHILVDVAADASAEIKAQKRELMESYRQQLLSGTNFAELASSVSRCPSAARGGDLGVFTRGKMAKPFEDAAFSQKENEIGEVIETPFGLHIIRVEKHFAKGPADPEQIAGILKQRSRALALADYIRKLQSTAEIKHSAAVRPPAPEPQP